MAEATLITSLIEAAQGWAASKADVERRQLIDIATQVVNVLENPAEKLARIGWGEPSRTAALQAAFELGLLDQLDNEPKSSQVLAANTVADPLLVGT